LVVLIASVPFLQGAFGTAGLGWGDGALTVGLALTVVPVLETVKWLERRGHLGGLA
jgi:hypothetical protein